MADKKEAFLRQINENIGIAHKVSRIYFDEVEEREDVIQEMMYQLWRSFETFDGKSKFSTWMYRVCLNTALTYRRKHGKQKHEPLTSGHSAIEEQKGSDKEESISLLYRAISQLNEINKAIVLLYLEDLSYEEIASITGLTKSNVSVRIVRIKKELETIITTLSKHSEHVGSR